MPALHKDTFTFLKGLQKNNSKAWFDEHRPQYEEVRNSFIAVVDDILKAMSKTDPIYGNLNAKDCLFRINRDVRFSKDKSPYKTNLAASINKNGKKGMGTAGYYIHIGIEDTFFGGGIWQPEPAILAKIRQEIDYNFAEYKKIVNNKTFSATYKAGALEENLVNIPKGYDATNPAAEILKQKHFIYSSEMTAKEIMDPGFAKTVAARFKVLSPFIEFLNRAAE